LKGETKNSNIHFLALELTDFDQIRSFVAAFKKQFNKLDVLINNAGLTSPQHKLTKHNLELTIATNHFGPFLLTNLLLDMVKASKGRIINLSSIAHRTMGDAIKGLDFDDINNTKTKDHEVAYARSKLANIMFTYELQRRVGSSVTCAAVHPGFVDSEFMRDFPFLLKVIIWPIKTVCSKSPKQGAQTTMHCVLKPDLEQGKYFADCQVQRTSDVSYNEENQRRLWELSERTVGLQESSTNSKDSTPAK